MKNINESPKFIFLEPSHKILFLRSLQFQSFELVSFGIFVLNNADDSEGFEISVRRIQFVLEIVTIMFSIFYFFATFSIVQGSILPVGEFMENVQKIFTEETSRRTCTFVVLGEVSQ